MLTLDVRHPTGVPSAKQPLLSAVHILHLAPRKPIFSVGVPGSFTLATGLSAPHMQAAVLVKLLHLNAGHVGVCEVDFPGLAVRPSGHHLFRTPRATGSQKNEEKAKDVAHHFFREMVKSTKSIKASLASDAGSSFNKSMALFR